GFVKLQLLLPGETAAPGTPTGKTGTPTAETAGTAFSVTVNAVDANWNVMSNIDTVAITSSDANATMPANAALVSGTKTFSVTLKTAGSATLTASDFTDPGKTASLSPSFTASDAAGALTSGTSANVLVSAGAYTKLQLIVPGETASPGSATGKTGTPDGQTNGTSFNVNVNAVDANWNLINTNDTVKIYSSDSAATLPATNALVL